MRRTQLKRNTPLRTKTPLRAKKTTKRKKRTPLEKYKAPAWFNRIPYGSHGSTPAQKRLWKVVSDTYREEDWETFGPNCPICNRHLESWKDGQLGHFHRYSLCHGWFKYERRNLAMICAGCNINDGGLTSFKFAEVLRMRFGEDTILWIEQENQRYKGSKLETWQCVDYVAKIAPHLVENE